MVRGQNGVLLFSDETFAELRTCLRCPKFDPYVSRNARAFYLTQLTMVSGWVAIAGAKMGCRDADDDKLLETALVGEADCLVTGDGDLLAMDPFRGVPFVMPATFLDSSAG